MITLSGSPYNYNYSLSPVIARLSTNRVVVTTGTKAQVVLNFTSTAAAPGQSIFFVFNGQGVTMVFSTTLGDQGNKIRTNVSSLPLAGYVAQVAADLRTNYLLQSTFDIVAGATSITVTSKEKGDEWTCVSLSSATGITVPVMTAGTDEVLNENFRLQLDLYVEKAYGTNVFEKIVSEDLEPFGNIAEFDLSELLHATFTKPDLPFWRQTIMTRCSNSLKRYYIAYSERYGSIPVNHRTDRSDVYHIYRGGVSAQEFPLGQPILQNWIWPQKKFLTWEPNNKEVTTYGQEYLYYSIPAGVGSLGFDAQVLITYSDGTSTQATIFSRSAASTFEIFCIPAGYDQIAIGLFNPSKDVTHYDIWLRDGAPGNADISERRRFYPVYRALYESEQICYSNSLGGMQMLTITGEIVTGIETEDVVSRRKLNHSYNVVDGDTFKSYAEKTDVFKASTGWVSKEVANVTDELFLAEYVYASDRKKERWLPVVINKASIEKYKTGADLYAINFEYILGYVNRVIEGDVAAPALSPITVTPPASSATTLVTSGGGPLLVNNNYTL